MTDVKKGWQSVFWKMVRIGWFLYRNWNDPKVRAAFTMFVNKFDELKEIVNS